MSSKIEAASPLAPLADPENSGSVAASGYPPRRMRIRFGLGEWLGVAPFAIFAVMFLIAPTLFLVGAAFVDCEKETR